MLGHYSKVNGDFLRAHGRGIEELDPRELCDLAYATLIAMIEQRHYALVAAGAEWKDSDDPLGEEITAFEERIGLREDPKAVAYAMHKQFMESQGKQWDETPVGTANEWWDQNVEFTDMEALDEAVRRKAAPGRAAALFGRKAGGHG